MENVSSVHIPYSSSSKVPFVRSIAASAFRIILIEKKLLRECIYKLKNSNRIEILPKKKKKRPTLLA